MHATAFVPGHVTGFFSTHPDEQPLRAGSRGGGVALSDGVETTVTEERGVTLNGESIVVEPVERVLDAFDTDLGVACETPLPLGSGFGVSGAMALGTAYVVNAQTDADLSENDLVSVAHRAEVESGTGLGDVVGQARGGIPLRLEPGAPGYGKMDGVPGRARVEYLSLGGLSTADVLGGDTSILSAAGERALATVRETPTLSTFVSASRQFADEAGLLTDALRAILHDVDSVGETASMAMLGETAFTLGTGLTDAGYDPAVCRIHPPGAGLHGE
ncbi:MAG: pantoate kinase [Halobacteriales archaeon]|nr:pantoate kinase [Halobacteriales archaeon]